MPAFSFYGYELAPTTASGVVTRGGIFLRREVEVGVFDLDGEVPARGSFTSPVVLMRSLTEIFSLEIKAHWHSGLSELDPLDHVRVQITLDGGVTYLAWTGAAWAIQGEAGTYNTLEDFNENCSLLNTTGHPKLGVRVELLRPVDANDSPALREIAPGLWWEFNTLLDIFETLREKLDSTFWVPQEVVYRFSAAGATLPFVPTGEVNPVGTFSAFNLTTDPTHTKDIFDSYDPALKTVTLTAAVALDDIVLIRFQGRGGIAVVNVDEAIGITSTPFLIVRVGALSSINGAGTNIGTLRDTKLGTVTRKGRLYPAPVLSDVTITFDYVSAKSRASVHGPQAIKDFLNRSLDSVHSGLQYRWIETVQADHQEMTSNSVSSGQWVGILRLFELPRDYRDVNLVSTLSFETRGATWRRENLEVVPS